MEKELSLKKMETNRRNARRSSGPRTRAGKLKVRWNALQHGLLSNEVVLPAGKVQERREEFARLLASLRRDLRPGDTLEEMMVEKVAVCYWRLRRVLRCETGEIHKGVETDASEELGQKALEVAQACIGLGSEPAAARNKLARSSWGLYYLTNVLNQVRQEVQQVGHLSPEAYKKLRQHFGGDKEGLARRCLGWSRRVIGAAHPTPVEAQEGEPSVLRAPADGSAPATGDDTASSDAVNDAAPAMAPEQCKKLIVDALWDEQIRLEPEIARLKGEEEQQRQGHLASLSVPSKAAMERLVRYEASLHRELHRTIRQLSKLQMQRKGQWTPWGAPRKLRNKAKEVV